jgi:nitronate monooxygenase
MQTRVTEMLNIQYPIIQGGMQYMSLAELASAVSNAGGLGIVPSMAFPDVDSLRAEVKKMKTLTDKPFGFNISLVPEVAMPEVIMDYIQVLVEEGVPVVETSGQRPRNFIQPLKDAGIKVIHKVTSIRHGLAAQEDGADIIAFVGAEGGGHPGVDLVSGPVLWAKAVEKISVPVLAAGGIVDSKSLYAAMALGVDGVLMATRFLATPEVNASDTYRQALLQIPENGTVLTMTSLRNAMRVANNEMAQEILQAEKDGATLETLMPLISGRRSYEAMQNGDVQHAQLSMGQGVGRINEIMTVDEIFEELINGFQERHAYMTKLSAVFK